MARRFYASAVYYISSEGLDVEEVLQVEVILADQNACAVTRNECRSSHTTNQRTAHRHCTYRRHIMVLREAVCIHSCQLY